MGAEWIEVVRNEPDYAASVDTLAVLLSMPPIVPFAMLRRIRRRIFGPGTLHMEATLCQRVMVANVSKDGLAFVPSFRERARDFLREKILAGAISGPDLRDVIACHDVGLSPLLLIEENMVWAHVSEPDPVPEFDRILAGCLLTAVRDHRMKILDWASGALIRLPESISGSPMGWLLSEVCAAFERPTRRIPEPDRATFSTELFEEVLKHVPSTLIGFHRDGENLELGPISRVRRMAIPVPAIRVRPITITATAVTNSTTAPDSAVVSRSSTVLDAVKTVRVHVGRGPVILRNAAGRTFELKPFSDGSILAPEDETLDEAINFIEHAWRTKREIAAEVVRATSPVGAVIRLVGAECLSAFLYFRNDDFRELSDATSMVGRTVDVVIVSFDRPLQRTYCRLVRPPSWSPGEVTEGTTVVGRVASKVNFGVFVALPTSGLGSDGPTIDGLLHKSEFPAEWPSSSPPVMIGDSLEVVVKSIDVDAQRIQLAVPDAWDHFDVESAAGAVIEGVIAKIVPFGVFVRLPFKIEGLLHNTEIAVDRALQVGATLAVRIAHVDRPRKRITLHAEPRLAGGRPHRKNTPAKETPVSEGTQISEQSARLRERVREVLLATLLSAGSPMLLSQLGHLLRESLPATDLQDWLGYGRFTDMLLALLPEARLSDDRQAVELTA